METIKNITDAAYELETGEVRIGEALHLLALILDDMSENNLNDEAYLLNLARRCEKYIDSLFILSRDLEHVKDDLHSAACACYAVSKRDRETVERVKREAVRMEVAESAANGVDVCEIIRGMGYGKLSDVAPEELDKVLDRVRQEARKARDEK